MIRVAVSGAAGKMGETVCAAIEGANDLDLTGRADPSLDTSLADVLDQADVIIDFTTPATAPDNAREALASGTHVVIGTSGFEIESLREAAESAPNGANCFVAPNFALGAVLMIEAAKLIAPHMPECEIVEIHRATKLDAPSGTALHTAKAIREAGGNVHEPIHSVRLTGALAHQEIVFGDEGQMLTIRHDSLDRSSFMPGVLLAVRKVATLPDRLTVGLEHLL
jgi:4-hydroxy-tetrahydrodipicolinate reductase